MNKPVQLDMFKWFAEMSKPPAQQVPAPSPSTVRDRRSAFKQRIADAGLVMDPYYDGDGLIWNPLGLEHPSRMLKFPLHARAERVYVVHPALADEPFVDEVERRLGERPVYDDCIRGVRSTYEHHHALDLCRRDRYQLLLDSMHLTTRRTIAETVAAELRGACEPKFAITSTIAREILTAIGVPETGMADDDILLEAVDREWFMPMGLSARDRELMPFENAWDCVHAYERKLVRRDRDGRAMPVRVREAA